MSVLLYRWIRCSKNKSVECVLPQFAKLNDFYYVFWFFSHYGNVSSCLFWVSLMLSWLSLLVCTSWICNICLPCLVHVWVPVVLPFYHCHPLCVASHLYGTVTRDWRHDSSFVGTQGEELWLLWESGHGRALKTIALWLFLDKPPLPLIFLVNEMMLTRSISRLGQLRPFGPFLRLRLGRACFCMTFSAGSLYVFVFGIVCFCPLIWVPFAARAFLQGSSGLVYGTLLMA